MPAWTVTVAQHSAMPGATIVTVTGTAGAAITVWRDTHIGARESVRNIHALDGSGHLQVTDPEAPFGVPITYTVETLGAHVAASVPITMPNPTGPDPVLLRSVVGPDTLWQWTRLVDQTGIEYRTRATTYPVIGRADPIAVGSARQLQSSVLLFYMPDIPAADRLLELFTDGTPILIRTPCHSKVRDMVFVALDVKESRFGGGRLIEADVQQVAWPHGETTAPAPINWTYQHLAVNVTANTYGKVPGTWATYRKLREEPRP
jgi:hypothetical protein